MKFNDFTLVDYSKNGRNDSKFYNIKNLSENYKVVTYFLNYFSNPKIMTLINHNGQLDPYAFKNDLPNSIYKRIDIMAEYIMDERTSFYDLKHVVDITPTKDVNMELLKTVLSVKLSLMITSSLSRKQPVEYLDDYFKKLFYKIITRYDVGEILDEIIYSKGILEEISGNNKNDQKQKKDLDYDFNKDKEYAIILSVLKVNLDIINPRINIKNSISNYYSSMIGSYDIITGRDLQFESKYSLYEAIRDLRTELLCKNIDETLKEKMLSKLNELINDNDFDDINKYNELRSILSYGGERPVDKSKKLMERYCDIEKYKYKGVVYHGFYNVEGTVDVIGALRYYENGYISCSKDINIAKSFSHTYDSGLFGGILEICVDDDIEAIDVEKILKDEFDKSQNIYKKLYNNFINEKEVLIKMPIKKFKYISPSDYERYYSNNKQYSLYKPKPSGVKSIED